MKLIYKLFQFVFIILIFSCSGYKDGSHRDNKSIETLISVPDIDIANLALVLAKEVYPEIDMQKYLHKIDGMVLDIRADIDKKDDPLYKIAVINDYLYKEKGFKYDLKDMNAR